MNRFIFFLRAAPVGSLVGSLVGLLTYSDLGEWHRLHIMSVSGVCQRLAGSLLHVNAVIRARDIWHGLLSAGNGPLFNAVNRSMYGMQQHNYPLLYYTHLNTADSINIHSHQASSPRTAEPGQRLCVGFHLNSDIIQKPWLHWTHCISFYGLFARLILVNNIPYVWVYSTEASAVIWAYLAVV